MISRGFFFDSLFKKREFSYENTATFRETVKVKRNSGVFASRYFCYHLRLVIADFLAV